ncbi:precorrin-6y C5,15-methyltransferase (decarboxylating) subunit CbiE [Phormidesmis priestleyi]
MSVVGIGEDGLAGLSPIARSLVDHAAVLVGGDRHLAMIPDGDRREKITWSSPIHHSIEDLIQRRGQAICVLASGDPMWYGIGVMLTRKIPLAEMTIIPALSTFSLACSRLGWSLTEVETLSLCSRPPALLNAYLYPGAKLLVLSEGKQTPTIVAHLLTEKGFGNSSLTVLERLGGERERMIWGIASDWNQDELDDLNAIAIECVPDSKTALSRIPGLPDDAYHHDGQLTKREIRAITLSALAPLPGQLLWDVGAGCGSIAIEWMRSHPRCRAIAIERSRTHYIADNANALGTPNLQILEGTAPAILTNLPQPDAIFIGGGATTQDLIETCWSALRSGGRLVANVVTLKGEQKLFEWHDRVGGEFTRISIQRAAPIGRFLGWKSLSPITQWVALKPPEFDKLHFDLNSKTPPKSPTSEGL